MPDLRAAQRVHLVGIGGSGMSALASLLLQMGKQVSGSDEQPSATTQRLAALGATVFGGHHPRHIAGADYLVRSSAVATDNAELHAASANGVTVRKLAEAVAELMQERSTVAVAGTHGKTTTTSLVTCFLEAGGIDPLALIGADTARFPLGARAGEGPVVIEADEYDRR
ncbi:MAG TPA: Mur ligase domain-containing protein, partial [Chloroflexota bacterium]|nr:Mur ligase domain-containing protein [Chloroflexota bacterium]